VGYPAEIAPSVTQATCLPVGMCRPNAEKSLLSKEVTVSGEKASISTPVVLLGEAGTESCTERIILTHTRIPKKYWDRCVPTFGTAFRTPEIQTCTSNPRLG
jgi:hypothetical protein